MSQPEEPENISAANITVAQLAEQARAALGALATRSDLEAFQELLAEHDRLKQLEQFMQANAQRFRGKQSADYEKAQEIRERIEALQQLAQDLKSGNFERLSPEQLQELLSEDGARSLIILRDLDQNLRDAGFLRDGKDGAELTPRAIRRIGAQALDRRLQTLANGPQLGRCDNRRLQMPRIVGQFDLDPLFERHIHPQRHARPPVTVHQGVEIGQALGQREHAGMKAPHQCRPQLGNVLE